MGVCRAVPSSADVEAAAAQIATTVQATGIVLAGLRAVSNGLPARYWYTDPITMDTTRQVPAKRPGDALHRFARQVARVLCQRGALTGSDGSGPAMAAGVWRRVMKRDSRAIVAAMMAVNPKIRDRLTPESASGPTPNAAMP